MFQVGCHTWPLSVKLISMCVNLSLHYCDLVLHIDRWQLPLPAAVTWCKLIDLVWPLFIMPQFVAMLRSLDTFSLTVSSSISFLQRFVENSITVIFMIIFIINISMLLHYYYCPFCASTLSNRKGTWSEVLITQSLCWTSWKKPGLIWSHCRNLCLLNKPGFVQTLEKSWKVLELKCWDFQAWKVLEKGIGPGKPWKSPGIL